VHITNFIYTYTYNKMNKYICPNVRYEYQLDKNNSEYDEEINTIINELNNDNTVNKLKLLQKSNGYNLRKQLDDKKNYIFKYYPNTKFNSLFAHEIGDDELALEANIFYEKYLFYYNKHHAEFQQIKTNYVNYLHSKNISMFTTGKFCDEKNAYDIAYEELKIIKKIIN